MTPPKSSTKTRVGRKKSTSSKAGDPISPAETTGIQQPLFATTGLPGGEDFETSSLGVPESDVELDDLGTGLTDETGDDLDDLTEELPDEFADSDFREELGDEADDVDLTEDLSEELGTEKFFRDSESSLEEDDETLPSW